MVTENCNAMEEKQSKVPLSDQLANERTFLAWIRTAVAIMGFGFVVVKFSIFIKTVSISMSHPPQSQQIESSHLIGISLVALGTAIIILSYLRYTATAKGLEYGNYYIPRLFIKMSALAIFLISLSLLAYLFLSI